MNGRSIYISNGEREREKERNLISFRTIAHTRREKERRIETNNLLNNKLWHSTSKLYTHTIEAMVAKQCDHVLAIGKREQN